LYASKSPKTRSDASSASRIEAEKLASKMAITLGL
jgi:hypothetical protein